MSVPKSEIFTQQQEHTFSLVEKHVSQLEALGVFNERVFPALRFYGYNFFTEHSNPTEEDLHEFTSRCLTINEQEARAARPGNPLCTIGGELEAFYTPPIRTILAKLQIPLTKEEDPSNRLWEVEFPWTYSADTQVVMLEELVKMHAVQPPFGSEEKFQLQRKRRLSLHLNYGMPEEMQDEFFSHPDLLRKLHDVSDAMILGFTSSQRISEMTPLTLSYVKEAELTSKTPQATEAGNIVFRVELRGLEFTQPLTFDLLQQSQRIMTAYFAWAMSKFVQPTEHEKALITAFIDFTDRIADIRYKYNIPQNFAGSQGNRQYAMQLASNIALAEEVQEIISQAAAKVDQLLQAA